MYYGRYNHVDDNGQRDSKHYWHKAEPAEPVAAPPAPTEDLLESARQTIGLFAEEIYGLTALNKLLMSALREADATLCECRAEKDSRQGRRGECNCDIHAAHRILRAALEGKRA